MPRDPDVRRLLLSAAFFAVCLCGVIVLAVVGLLALTGRSLSWRSLSAKRIIAVFMSPSRCRDVLVL